MSGEVKIGDIDQGNLDLEAGASAGDSSVMDGKDRHVRDAIIAAEADLTKVRDAFKQLYERQMERDRERNAERWQERARRENRERGLIEKILGRNVRSELDIAQAEAIWVQEQVEALVVEEGARSRAEAQNVLAEVYGYGKMIQKAQEALDFAKSLLLVQDPIRAELMAYAEKNYQDAAVELEKIGLHEKARELRDRAHSAAVEAAINYDAYERPARERIKRMLEEKVTEAIMSPGQKVTILIKRADELFGKDLRFYPNQLKLESSLVDDAVRRLYDLLSMDPSQNQEVPNPDERSWYKMQVNDNGVFVLTHYFIKHEDEHEDEPDSVYFELTRIKNAAPASSPEHV